MKDTKILGVDNVNLYCLLVKSNSVLHYQKRVLRHKKRTRLSLLLYSCVAEVLETY